MHQARNILCRSHAEENLGSFPRLQAATLNLANYYLTNAEQINEAFKKLGVFTEPK